MDLPLVGGADLAEGRALRVPKPLNTRKSHSVTWSRLKSVTVAPLALPAENTKVSLPSPPVRVFAPALTSVLASLLPVPVSPEPVRYNASTLAALADRS